MASLFQTIFIGTFSIYIIIVIPIKNSFVNRRKTGRNIVVVVVVFFLLINTRNVVFSFVVVFGLLVCWSFLNILAD